jgi:hypothetical protein
MPCHFKGIVKDLECYHESRWNVDSSDRDVWEACQHEQSSCSPQTAMMTALNRSRPQFSNTTRLKVSPSSRWPMTRHHVSLTGLDV